MSSKQAPPLGNLTRDNATASDKPLPRPSLPTAKQSNSVTQDVALPVKELVFSQPGIPDTMDFSKVGGDAGRALAEYVPPSEQPLPILKSINSRPEMPVSEQSLTQLAGDESTPFNYTGFGAGTVGREQIQLDPTAGIARHNSPVGKFVDNPLNTPGTSDVVIANSRPVQSFGYTEGLTQSQRNSREFFNGLQEVRQTIQPHMLPALQFTPQQLNPNVAGGFSPTAETKGPLSWLVDGPQKNINPGALEFGASGGGLLGGIGWVFGRLSPMTYLKGAALDVSRSAAALYEGGSSALTELFKSGDFGKAMSVGGAEMASNYYSNAPQARGVYTETFGGSKAVGDELSQSYFLAALSGMTDMPFSGVGNKGDASRNVVLNGDNFNPFGVRDPFRSGFNTGALEAKERQQGAWFGHGYDQWVAGAAGLVLGDVLLEGRVDKLALGAISKAISGSKVVTQSATTAARRISQEAIENLRNSEVRNRGTIVHVPTKLPSPGVRVNPDITAFITPPTQKPGALVPTAKYKSSGITQVVQGEFVESGSELMLRRTRRAPEYYNPIANRYLPSGGDPFAVKSNRVYVPEGDNGLDITPQPSGVGAIVPYQGDRSAVVPAVLGVGGKPGGIPINPRVENGRIFLAGGSTPPVTVWDDATQSFITNGRSTNQGVVEVPVYSAPGNVPKPKQTGLDGAVSDLSDDIIDGEVVTQGLLPPRSVTKPDIPVIDNPTLITPTTSKGSTRPGFVDRLNRVPTAKEPKAPINSRTLYKEGKALDELPPLVPKNTPNFTVQPSTITDTAIRESHVVDEVTGVFVNAAEQASVQARTLQAPTVAELPPVVPVPIREVQYVTAEAISPSLTGADIVRRLTSGDDIAGATYNTRQVERQQRSIASVVALAKQVTLPNGVRILSDDIKDVSVMKFSRLQKKVDAAIIASGLNPSSTEAAGIRRLFDRAGKPLPTNLAPDFAIEVAPRTLTSPSSYVKPATQVADGNVTWTGRAARYQPSYDLSSEYAVGVKVKYDDELKRIVPIDGQDMKLIPPVRSEPTTGLSTQVINREQLRTLSVPERQVVVSKSFKDGYEVPQGAIDDVLTPDITVDAVAAKDYAKSNIPKEHVPLRMDREARLTLAKHQELVEEVSYTGNLITDVSTQLTDVERSLSTYLKQIDELPDIGVETIVDDVPFSPLPPVERVSGIVPTSTTKLGADLYHGTRVQDLAVGSVNPLEGAARSEYGTGLWLTTKQDIAVAASGRSVPDNSVPNVNRTFGDNAYVHQVDGTALDSMNIVNASDVPSAKVVNDLLAQLDNNRYVFSDVIPYGDDLLDEVVNLLESGKVTKYGDFFGQVDDLVHKTAKRNLSIKPDEYELTYVQRVMTDMLQSSGVQGITNGVNTALYDTRALTTKFVHDVTDIAGDASDDVTSALHNVNLLQESLNAQPTSKLLQVQLAEAKAVAASKIRDSLSDELESLNKLQAQQTSKLMDADDLVAEVASKQRQEELIRATTKDDNTYESFSKELNREWKSPCL